MVETFSSMVGRMPALNAALVFPTLMLALNFGAAVVSLTRHDWSRGVYWLASGICVAAVTFR